jgi:hypothetical protein
VPSAAENILHSSPCHASTPGGFTSCLTKATMGGTWWRTSSAWIVASEEE